jgi:hypothetical protein
MAGASEKVAKFWAILVTTAKTARPDSTQNPPRQGADNQQVGRLIFKRWNVCEYREFQQLTNL